jgi:hypothetical protein
MNNEEFQKIILDTLTELKNDVSILTEKINEVEQSLQKIDFITAANNLEIVKLKKVK